MRGTELLGRRVSRLRLVALTPESEALLHLDALRFLAAMAIIVLHFRTNLLSVLDDAHWWFERLEGLAVAVDLFFVISGFVISWLYQDRLMTWPAYSWFLRKRVARLVPLHWLTLAFFVSVGLISQFAGIGLDSAGKYDWNCLLPNALLLQAWNTCQGPSFNTVSWSVSAEMALYCMFPLLFFIAMRAPRLFLGATILLLALLEGSSIAPPWTERTFQMGVVRALPAFALGISIYLSRAHLSRIPQARIWLLFCIGLFVASLLADAGRTLLVYEAYAIAALGVAADMQGRVSPLIHKLAPFGRLTYSLYMLHPLVQSLVIVLVGRKILHLDGFWLSAWSLFAIAVCCLLAYMSLWLFEEPARRWIASGRKAYREANERVAAVR